MLQFLRKHQKYFFIVITAAIIVSFSFFGTYSTMNRQADVPDKEIGQGVCGKPMMQQELAALCRMIESSSYDRAQLNKGGMPNFLNDGVVEKDFLGSGLAVMLAKHYFDDLRDDLNARVKKIHHFRPYAHPRSPAISVEGAWSRYMPGMVERFRALKMKSDQSTLETLALMAQLYVDQSMISGDVVKQILMMQQNQMGVEADPVLANSDLALFGFKSMEDWFGPRFISLVGQFILNAAQIAEQKGYEVRTEEVRADLFQNIYQGYRQISQNTSPQPEEVERFYQMKMRSLGLDETQLISTWKKVLLFRRLFEDGSGSVLIDPLAYRQFDEFARENVSVSVYQLPPALQFADLRSMLKFQIYLEAVALDPSRVKSDLRLPKQTATLEQIEKRVPELVERQFELEWSSVDKETLARGISVKDTWAWEEGHFEVLKKTFPELTSLNAADEKLRAKIDQFARLKMVEEKPAELQTALENAASQNSVLGVKARGSEFPFQGVKDNAEFVRLLETASLKGDAPNGAADRLSFYSADGAHFYRIAVVRREEAKKVLSFEESSKNGTLDKLLDKRLEDAYPDVRRKDTRSFQLANGNWKPYKEVRDQVGKLVFADLLKAVEDNYRSYYGFLPGKEGELPTNFYSSARLVEFMKEAQNALKNNPTDPQWLKGEEDSLATQWLLEKNDTSMERCTETTFSKDEMFTLQPHEWSSVKVGERGALAFYFVQERGAFNKPFFQGAQQGHQILSYDARRDMCLQVIQKIQQKKAIDLSSVIAEERR